jgi:hypothetical protein
MQVVFHLGAHFTDDGLLIRSILRNRARLATEGIIVPGPSRYRELLGDLSTKLRGAPADADTEQMILDAICDDDSADRIVLSSDNFLCRPQVALGQDGLYPKANKSAWLRNCLPRHDVSFAMAIRSPATFVPEIAAASRNAPIAIENLPLGDLLWSDVIADITSANPGADMIVWCHEDTPFIWSEIIREITQHDPFTELDGEFDMLDTIMTGDGMTRLQEFLDTRGVSDQFKRRRAVSAFLEAHAIDEEIEAEIDLPGWTEDTIEQLTELYEEDVSRIASMAEVTFVSP